MKLSPRTLPAAAALLAGTGLVLVAAPPSYAVGGGVTVSTLLNSLVITDNAGGNNEVWVSQVGAYVYVRDVAIDPTVGNNCVQAAGTTDTVACPAAGLFGLSVNLGAGNDAIRVQVDTLSGTIAGGPGDDSLSGGGGDDNIYGQEGNDTVSYVESPGAVLVMLGNTTGNGGAEENDTLHDDIENATGSAFADEMYGSAGANTIRGGDGDDRLDGGLGADVLEGDAGTDTVAYTSRTAPVTATINGSLPGDSGEAGEGDFISSSVENLLGGEAGDHLVGSHLANVIAGGPGGDYVDGAGGDDRIDGGLGGDTLIGGLGVDAVDYSGRTAPVTVHLDSPADSGAAGEEDALFGMEVGRGGSGNDLFVGGADNNVLIGNAGDDTFLGGAGNDTFDGGAGTDAVSYEDHGQAVVATLDALKNDGAAGETDLIQPSVENLTGGAGADRLTGNGAANLLQGGAGDDVLDGGAGADVLRGGAGTDTVTYAGRSAPVTVTLDGAAGDGEAGEGDLVAADVENATGGEAADRLTGSEGANVLLGGGGDDVLDGGLGADVLGGGAGVDVATYAARTTRLVIRLDDVAGDGAKGEGDDVRTDVENVIGGRLRDKIIGSAAANVLTGGRGADVLKGKAGKDRALGGAGRDRCVAEVERSCAR